MNVEKTVDKSAWIDGHIDPREIKHKFVSNSRATVSCHIQNIRILSLAHTRRDTKITHIKNNRFVTHQLSIIRSFLDLYFKLNLRNIDDHHANKERYLS